METGPAIPDDVEDLPLDDDAPILKPPRAELFPKDEPLKILCVVFWAPLWLLRRHGCVSLLLLPVRVVLELVWLAIQSIEKASQRVLDVLFPPPRQTVDADIAARYGIVFDENGHPIGRAVPMRVLTLVVHYIRVSALAFLVPVFAMLVWLFVRWLGTGEAALHNLYLSKTTIVLPPDTNNFRHNKDPQ